MSDNVLRRVTKTIDNINKEIDSNMNREQRRNYDRNNRYKRNKNYGRY